MMRKNTVLVLWVGCLLVLSCLVVQADIFQFGFEGTEPVIKDFDGDGLPDFGLFHAAGGTWYIQQTTAGLRIEQWGFAGTIPVVDDYDRDGKADVAVYNPADGMWYIDAVLADRGNSIGRGPFSFIGTGYDNTASENGAVIGGGTRIVSGTVGSSITAGVSLAVGGNSWSAMSDYNMKENFTKSLKKKITRSSL